MWERLMTALFGSRCSLGCGKRVYPKDIEWHYQMVHE